MLSSLSIVVPAYNEAATIESVVVEALSVGTTVARDVEVLVCDDGSIDETRSILQRLARTDPRVRVLRRPRNRGIEMSVRALHAAARGEFTFFISADRQWPMDSLVTMAQAMERRGADLVVGTRRNKPEVYSTYRRVVSRAFEVAVSWLGAPVGDPGSIKFGRAECFRLPVVSTGPFGEGERLIRAARAGYRVIGCDVEFRTRGAGKALGARPAVVAGSVADLIKTFTSLAVGWPRPVAAGHEDDLVIG